MKRFKFPFSQILAVITFIIGICATATIDTVIKNTDTPKLPKWMKEIGRAVIITTLSGPIALISVALAAGNDADMPIGSNRRGER